MYSTGQGNLHYQTWHTYSPTKQVKARVEIHTVTDEVWVCFFVVRVCVTLYMFHIQSGVQMDRDWRHDDCRLGRSYVWRLSLYPYHVFIHDSPEHRHHQIKYLTYDRLLCHQLVCVVVVCFISHLWNTVWSILLDLNVSRERFCVCVSLGWTQVRTTHPGYVVQQTHVDAWHDLLFNRLVQFAETPPDFDTGEWVERLYHDLQELPSRSSRSVSSWWL